MPTLSKPLLLAVLLLQAIQYDTRAHDIGSSNATFWVRATGIDVELYMGLNAGALLIAGDGEQVVITPNTFPDFSDRLQAVAPTLFTLTAGDGATLQPDAVAVSMTEQTDALFNLHYPLPAAMPGTLKIHAAYLEKMVANHVGTIYAMNAVGDRFGYGEVRPDAEDFQVRLPAVNALIGNARPPIAPSSPIAPAQPSKPWFLWALLGVGTVVIALVASRGMVRQSDGRKTGL